MYSFHTYLRMTYYGQALLWGPKLNSMQTLPAEDMLSVE